MMCFVPKRHSRHSVSNAGNFVSYGGDDRLVYRIKAAVADLG